ncbi:MAG: glycosyltransferase family 4 protein [Patescibacteria group bacterium]|jgi:phosphatidylinositol alpha-1,6-mannosyltransferase
MSSDIKKTLLVTLDFPPRLGGVATFYYNVCKNLPPNKIVVLAPEQIGAEGFDQKQNFTIIRDKTVVLPPVEIGTEGFDQKQDFTIIRKKLLNRFPETFPKGICGIIKITATIRWLSIIKHLAQTIKNHQIELIQVGQILPLGTLALIYKKRKNIPYIVYAHGLDITLPQKFMRKKTLLKKIIANAQNIVANSYWTKDELIKLGAEKEKVIVVHPGPNLKTEQASEWKMAEITEEHELKGKKILLTVGRLVERKGHDMVIKALPKIIKAVPNVVYLIVGGGPNRKKLEELVNQNNLGDYVKFVGSVTQNDLASFYQIGDVFIMPARRLPNGDVEGFGIVYLEANLFGKPVIGGKSGGVPEAVLDGQTGILVNPTDTEEIAQAAIKLLTDQAYAERLGLQGLQRVEEEFDWHSQTERIKAILK